MTTPPYGPNQPGQYSQPPGQYPPGGYPPMGPPPTATNGLAVGALIVGIVALLTSFIPLVGPFIAIPGGLVAVILGLIGLGKKTSKGLAITGTILGALAIVIAIVMSIALGLFFKGVADTVTTEHAIDYKATVASGSAEVQWGIDVNQKKDFTGTWTMSENLAGIITQMTVTGDNDTMDQAVTCEIKVDGKVVVSNSGTGMVTCVAPLVGQ